VEKKDEFDMIESSALRLSAAIKGKRLYVELDDPHATPLSRLVGYIIPKSVALFAEIRITVRSNRS